MHFLTASSFARPLFHGPLFWLAYPLFGFATTATGLPLRLLCLLARPPPAFFSLLAGFLCFPASAGTPLLFLAYRNASSSLACCDDDVCVCKPSWASCISSYRRMGRQFGSFRCCSSLQLPWRTTS